MRKSRRLVMVSAMAEPPEVASKGGGQPTGTPSDAPVVAGRTLLAVDLGLRTGLALYGEDGRLLRYRSTHFPNVGTLKRALPRVLDEAPNLAWLVCEGDRHYGTIWARLAEKRGAKVLRLSAEHWRGDLLSERERGDGVRAKESADKIAREVIAAFGAKRPTSLTHDVAEAILIGLWGVLEVGWLSALPAGLGREVR